MMCPLEDLGRGCRRGPRVEHVNFAFGSTAEDAWITNILSASVDDSFVDFWCLLIGIVLLSGRHLERLSWGVEAKRSRAGMVKQLVLKSVNLC